MQWIDALMPQTRHHYRWLDAAVGDVGHEHASSRLTEKGPSIAWIVGHLTDVSDSVAEAVGGIGRMLDPAAPQAEVADERTWRALVHDWNAVSVRTLASLERLSDEVLESAPSMAILPQFADRLSTRHAFWSGHLFHVAYHLGQVGSLRAASGLGWAESGA
ncbi:MAG: DinB family protein [bacterium]|nr:DinB family protein [bacterium]